MPPVSRYSRNEKLLGGLDIGATRGLEIGALATPILRPPEANIRFVDHADQAALQKKYANEAAVKLDEIVAVDAVWGDRTLAECFPDEYFDYVLASHVIEHVPDMIGWLKEIADVLRPDGRLILAIPDRRYTFDVFRRETSLSELIDNHLRGVRRPTPGQVFDCNASSVAFDHVMAWSAEKPLGKPAFYVTRDYALAMARQAADGCYIDSHCSVFTARSLLETLDGLLELKLLPYRLERFHVAPVGSNEMVVVLVREPPEADAWQAREAFRHMLEAGADSEGLRLDDEPGGNDVASCELLQRIGELEHAVSALRCSTSWRLTAPVRSVARWGKWCIHLCTR